MAGALLGTVLELSVFVIIIVIVDPFVFRCGGGVVRPVRLREPTDCPFMSIASLLNAALTTQCLHTLCQTVQA
jgi:hypothetical protein